MTIAAFPGSGGAMVSGARGQGKIFDILNARR
jgi:hypothetical protein